MLKLNVGLSQKIGQANFGSRGASVNLEVELESGLVSQPEGLHERIRHLFGMARAAVEEELACQEHPRGTVPGTQVDNGAQEPAADHRPNGNGRNGHRASEKQLSYARQLAGQIRGLGVRRLETLADRMFGKPLAELTSLDASGLIDMLKSLKAGEVDLNAALNGASS